MPIEADDNNEEVIIRYNDAFSEDDINSDDDEYPTLDQPSKLPAGTPILQTTTTTTTTTVQNNVSSFKPITSSNFKPDNDNLIFDDNYVTIGLKQSEYLLIKGQYKLTIQRGCLKIDTVSYHASEVPIEIIAPSFVSLPVLYADQVTNMSLVTEDRTEINDHLFSSDYKTVVKLENHFTGLEDIGLLYPSLKNIFPNYRPDSEEYRTELEERFRDYSFQPILHDEGSGSSAIGTVISKNWLKQIETITGEVLNFNDDINNNNQMKLLVVGSKNSGKSTFVKQLLNHILYKTDYCIPVNMMDLDPGQPEYSPPDSISISNISKEIIGFNTSPLLDSSALTTMTNKILIQEYVGYSNPNIEPQRYEQLCAELCDFYEAKLSNLNQVLLINTPGWIKGYGLELLKKLTERIQPTHVLYLAPENARATDGDTESQLMANLKFDKFVSVNGIHLFLNSIPPRYSAAQLRFFKILSYFHNTQYQNFKSAKSFDFTPLILSHSPYSISYNDTDVIQFKGISLLNVLDPGTNLRQEFLRDCFEAVVVGIYTIDIESYQNMILSNQVSILENFPNLINGDISSVKMKFHGLSLVHSLDMNKKLINLYTPLNTSQISQDGDLIILVRGRTEVPIEEVAPRDFHLNDAVKLPYVTFEKDVGKGGRGLKIRRNILRRSQQDR